MKKVSIIIPLYKSAPHIKALLDNILNQTYTSLEVLLINDGSPDETKEVVQSEMKVRNDNRVFYFEKENGGIADTKNYGINHATGDYIMFCDHDDWLTKDAVEELVNALETTNSDMAVAQYVRDFKYKKSFIERLFPFQVLLEAFPTNGGELVNHKAMLIEVYQALWGKLYIRELFTDFQFNVELNGMDDLGSTSILMGKAKRIVGVPKILYHYAYYKTSTIQSATSTFENKKIYDAYGDIEKWYHNAGLTRTYSEELEYLYFYHCVLSYGVRTLQRSSNYKEELKAMRIELKEKFPHYKKNKYYKDANFGMKLFLPLIKIPIIVEVLHKVLK